MLRSATMEYMADLEGQVTDDLLKLYYDLARGGVGLIITGCAAVEEKGRAWAQQLGIWDDRCIEGLRRLAAVIRTYGDGCRSAVQLAHQGSSKTGYSYGAAEQGYSLETVTAGDIQKTIRRFGEAAARVKAAGFDAVAVHGAHGYLLSEFLSPATNPRRDRWGSSLRNRMRLSLEVYRAIRRRVGEDFPILWKLNTADYLENGAGPEEYAAVAGELARAGVNLIEMSGGLQDQIRLRARLKKEAGPREAYFYSAVAPFRRAVGTTPLAITGGIRSLTAMEDLLEAGVDLIGLCRPLLCEPSLPRRLLSSPHPRRARCTSCNQCLLRIARQPVKCVAFDPFQKIVQQL
ncbi:MAG: NADH:flavin oxidoreductase [Deltaproteobacteria bacterium]|nr:NADH:flavin oxidoreductase [Deltaproteobacteria bacterium]